MKTPCSLPRFGTTSVIAFRIALLFIILALIGPLCVVHAADELKPLRTIYLSCHSLPWLAESMEDHPNISNWETWPGRRESIRPFEFERRARIYQMIREAKEDEGLMIIPSWYPSPKCPKSERELIEYGQSRFGKRCVVTSASVRMQSLGAEFESKLAKDRKDAEARLSTKVPAAAFENEFAAWTRAKAWITDLRRKLATNGYTFDPATVEFVCAGSDWRGCAASYPIMIGRALNLTKPIERRWELITHDENVVDISASIVIGNIPLAHNIQLFIFKDAAGKYSAEYWEGNHGPMDPAHEVSLKFPEGSVRLRNRPGKTYGQVVVPVGCGGHTTNKELVIEAVDNISLDDFHKALVSGVVFEKALASDK